MLAFMCPDRSNRYLEFNTKSLCIRSKSGATTEYAGMWVDYTPNGPRLMVYDGSDSELTEMVSEDEGEKDGGSVDDKGDMAGDKSGDKSGDKHGYKSGDQSADNSGDKDVVVSSDTSDSKRCDYSGDEKATDADAEHIDTTMGSVFF